VSDRGGREISGWLVALVGLVVAFVVGACTGGGGHKQAAPTTTTQPVPTAPAHGDIVVAAEQQPACMDWFAVCGSSRWGVSAVEANTLPRAYDVGSDGSYRPSALLTGEATMVVPKVPGPPQVVTYTINPQAVWSDHQPITSADFQYTWQQVVSATEPIDKTGYSQIESINTSQPFAAVVTFSKPYAGWKTLFGGSYAVLPSHLLATANRTQAMSAGYKFSGGPWQLDHWTKGSEIKLVANPAYWGKRPNLDSVTFKLVSDLATEEQGLSSGQMAAAYPQAQFEVGMLKAKPATTVDAVAGASIEALWFNTQKAPLDHVPVRQALAYATDRDALAVQVLGAVSPGVKALQSFYTPVYGKAYTTPFSRYVLNAGMVGQLMTGDGWAKGPDGVWAKGAVKAALELKIPAGDTRRTLTAQILQNQWTQAGFLVTVVQSPLSGFVGADLPGGNFQIALYDRAPTRFDLGQCVQWCGAGAAGGGVGLGGNLDHISDPALDRLWQDVDSNLNGTARLASAAQAQARLADLVPALPLVALPDVLVVKSDKVAVEGGTFQHSVLYGPFPSLNAWYVRPAAGP
jgi:peptide/nickel transport system substrate-binding protein